MKDQYPYLINGLQMSGVKNLEWIAIENDPDQDKAIEIPQFPIELSFSIKSTDFNPELFSLLMQEINQDTIPYDGPPIIVIPVGSEIQSNQLVRLRSEESDHPFNVMFRSPIELLPGDLCLLDTRTGELLATKRGEELVWHA